MRLLPRRQDAACLGALLVATLLLFGDVLLDPSPRVLSHQDADVRLQFLHWRAFGFGELARGNLALWNPHIFSGTPFLAGFQSALLYPPNWLYLVLPLRQAVNWGVALHVLLLGALAFAWARGRGLRPAAALVAGLLATLCGAHQLHVYAGHLSNLCTMAWAPAVLLSVEGLLRGRGLPFALLGAFALAMQVLAGHPQYVAYTLLAAGLYAVLALPSAKARARVALALAAALLGGLALSAVQLLPGLEAARASVRSGGLTFEQAATFSLPPENLLTLVAPGVLGGARAPLYWGRCYLWEVSLFVGVAGLVLAVLGALAGDREQRRLAPALALALLVLALGAHTPLFALLYEWLPGFGAFRGTCKLGFFASLYLALLAGIGLERLLAEPAVGRRAVPIALTLAAALLAGAAWTRSAAGAGSQSAFAEVVVAIRERAEAAGEFFGHAGRYADERFYDRAAAASARSLLLAGATALLVAARAGAARRRPRAAQLLAALAVAEVLVAARWQRPTFDPDAQPAGAVAWSQLDLAEDQRILDPTDPDRSLSAGTLDVWGYDPGVSRRYAELMTATQGRDPDSASQYLAFSRLPEVYAMLRLRQAVLDHSGRYRLHTLPAPMERLQLIHDCAVLPGRDAVLSALLDPGFDPRALVLLEGEPEPAPRPRAGPERVALLDASTDHLTVEAELTAPGLLLVTDAWSSGWRARALEGSAQDTYEVLPADYALRAVPLGAGRHRLRLEYLPTSFVVGRWISVGAWIAFAASAAVAWRRRPAPG